MSSVGSPFRLELYRFCFRALSTALATFGHLGGEPFSGMPDILVYKYFIPRA